MKELSIEQKAKRYDEAIKRAEEYYKEGKTLEYANDIVSDIFLELKENKESEDDRIRKGLIGYFLAGKCENISSYHGISTNDILDWLEKQGEKIDVIGNFDTEFEKQVSCLIASAINKDYEYTKDFVKWAANGLLEYAKHEIKKQGEQKTAYLLDNSESNIKFPFKAKVKSSGTIVTIHGGQLGPNGKEWIKYQSDVEDGYKLYDPNNLELVCENEQKPLWSEEDENVYRKLHNLIYAVPYCDSRKEFSDWLESIKDRVGCKANCTTTKEWSEEDEQYLLVCKNALAKYQTTDKWDACIISRWLENKLTSLKERYTWKPSDEQMDALYTYIYNPQYFNSPDPRMELVESVYQDLKKLKG